MGCIHFMEYHNKYTIYKYKQISADNDIALENYIKIINNSLSKADKVYLFRSYNHLKVKNDLLKWSENYQSNELKKVDVYFEKFQRILEVKSSDGSSVLEINLNHENNRAEFIQKFRIDYSNFSNFFSNKVLEKKILIKDPHYDQYDFMFVKNGKIYVWTSIHELLLFVNEECYEE